jgi:hypothetical protein
MVTLNSFFTITVGATTYPRGGATDPRLIYDRRSGHWFACVIDINGSVNNALILTVSRTNDPTGLWDKYVTTVGTASLFADYETLGMDDNGVYFGANMFTSTTNPEVRILATPKAPLIAGSPSLGTVSVFTGITDMYGSPQPSYNFDTVSGTGACWFLAASTTVFANINYRKITWSGSVPSISSTTVLTTNSYGSNAGALTAPASGSSPAISIGDDRILTAVVRGGKLWATRGVPVNSSGTSASADRSACEWFQLDASGPTLSVLQQGRVFDPSAAPFRFYYYPSITVSGQGDVAMGFSGSKSTEFIGSYFTGRLSSDPLNTMGTIDILKAGLAAYSVTFGGSRNRWGDFSFTSVDPNDDMTLWTIQEYANTHSATFGSDTWGTWAAQLKAPLPATPSMTDTSVTQGNTNVNVVVTGTSSSGSGFFDPGPGFPNHISASVGGTGVTVNSVTFTDSTHVTLNLTVAGNAATGARTITVTNPDGQFATSAAGILTVNAATPTATPTNINTPTNTATSTFTATPTRTNTNTATATPTPTFTATATATPTLPPTASPTPTPLISGTVTYGNAAAPPKYISNATVTGAGSPTVMTTTAAPGGTAGQYTLTGFGPGSYTVSLSKTTGQNGINSFDAAKVAQHVAGTVLLTNDNQRVTADVSNNGMISSFDAAQIATFVATGSSPGIAGQWRFFVAPGPTFPVGSSATTRTYSSVSGPITGQDYIGLLEGDVTGNWTSTGARSVSVGGPEKNVVVKLPDLVTPAEKQIIILVTVENVADINVVSYEFDLKYDPSMIRPLPDPVDVTGTVSRGLSVVSNAAQPGLLRVVVYGAFPIEEDGVLLNLGFKAVGTADAVSSLSLEQVMFNEGDPAVVVTDGSIQISAADQN